MRTYQSGILRALLLAALVLAPAAASAYTVFVTNEKDNTVSIIDSAKLEVVKTVKVGQRPRGVILSKDHRWLLVCASGRPAPARRHPVEGSPMAPGLRQRRQQRAGL